MEKGEGRRATAWDSKAAISKQVPGHEKGIRRRLSRCARSAPRLVMTALDQRYRRAFLRLVCDVSDVSDVKDVKRVRRGKSKTDSSCAKADALGLAQCRCQRIQLAVSSPLGAWGAACWMAVYQQQAAQFTQDERSTSSCRCKRSPAI